MSSHSLKSASQASRAVLVLAITLAPMLCFGALPVITDPSEPGDAVVLEGRLHELRVVAEGTPPLQYQWFFRESDLMEFQAIHDATNAVHGIGPMSASDSGQYYCRVENLDGAVQSRTAEVAMEPDLEPPVVVRASWVSLRHVVITFDEPLDDYSGIDPFNFSIGAEGGGGWLFPVSANLDGNIVGLELDRLRDPEINYTVLISYLEDLYGNVTFDVLAPITPLNTEDETIVDWNASWRYSISQGDLGVGWKEFDYDDSGWLEGTAPMGHPADEPFPPEAGLSLNTWFGFNPNAAQSTTYYRTRFVNTGDPLTFSLIVSNLVDDGSVIYLNGTELARFGMAPGTVTHDTLADRDIEIRDLPVEVVEVLSSALRLGENVLAMEVHQATPSSPEVIQALSLTRTLFIPSGPVIDLPTEPADRSVMEGDSTTLFVVASGEPSPTYQWIKSVSGHWTSIEGATSSVYTIPSMRLEDAGNYSCYVTSPFKSVQSRWATGNFVPYSKEPLRFNANGPVFAVAAQADGKILVGGQGGPGTNFLGRLHPDGSLDDSFQAIAEPCCISVMAVEPDGNILVAGSFNTLNGQPRQGLARLTPDGNVDPQFVPELLGGTVHTLLLQANSKITLGGDFTELNGSSQPHLGRLHPDGTLDPQFRPEVSGAVHGLAIQGNGRLLIGGDFTEVGGRPRARIARLFSADGAAEQSLTLNDCGTAITWSRAGAAPLLSGVQYEQSLDGLTYNVLGTGTRVESGWRLDGVDLPESTEFHVRARGTTIEGHANGSGGLVDQVETFFLATSQPVLTGLRFVEPAGSVLLECRGREGMG